MTLTVYRVRADGTRTPVLSSTTVRDDVHDPERLILPGTYPPCQCPRHRARRPPGRR
ncbi:hypothetical protein [Streptomyces gobiensis]|uniref:hypothetical protein n=1 Tax=Streptomyces gobiensis TaxID=2875706 RepID=UPI001E2BB635|nr:hypothetical protein [Streptomyces gobiensis]UGY92769.1 hypothetical protein test1122_14285 [Streptomyces gobiensis]